MTGSAFIEIETDYEYVSGQMNEKAARFLMDFYHVSGDLEYTLKDLAIQLKETALEYLELNGITGGRKSNLAQGIEVFVRGSAIEMRSTAYVLPVAGKLIKGEDGNKIRVGDHIVMRSRSHWKNNEDGTPALPTDKKGHNRNLFYLRNRGPLKATANMIMPQGVDYVGATGGHFSLMRKQIKDSEGKTVAYDSHGQRYGVNPDRKYRGTKNVVYYGAHVEYGHKTRDGGGIGFVQARPHLRPALRTVAAASTGMLSQTMSSMLYGLGSDFDSIRHQGRSVYGLNFGANLAKQQEINQFINQFGAIKSTHLGSDIPSRVRQLRSVYSVRTNRRDIGFGKKIDYEGRYGYDDDMRAVARKFQRNSRTQGKGHEYVPPRKDWMASYNKAVSRGHLGMQYKYPSTIPHKTTPRKTRRRNKTTTSGRRKVGVTPPTYLGKTITHGKVGSRRMKNIVAGNYKHRPRKIWGKSRKGIGGRKKGSGKRGKKQVKEHQNVYDPHIGRRDLREPNPGGADRLRPASWQDFMVGAPPNPNFFKGWSNDEIRAYEESYRQEKNAAMDAARKHNEAVEFYKKAQWYADHLDD